MKLLPLALLTLVLASVGCVQRLVSYTDGVPTDNETGIPAISVDEFAKEQGMTRKEARDFFRKAQEEMDAATPKK